MINTHLIGKHLPLIKGNKLPDACALCGVLPNDQLQGLPISGVLSDGFMDTQYLSDTGYLCVFCAACIGKGQPQTEWIRTTSFLATPTNLLRLKREDLWKHIFNPPDEPFIFGITYAHKKHISFKSSINLPYQSPYKIQTENMTIEIDLPKIDKLCIAIQNWYSICKNTGQLPTWFTKDEIMQGCKNYKKIEQYGTNKYLKENEIIKPYRRTGLLQLLCYALNKTQERILHD